MGTMIGGVRRPPRTKLYAAFLMLCAASMIPQSLLPAGLQGHAELVDSATIGLGVGMFITQLRDRLS